MSTRCMGPCSLRSLLSQQHHIPQRHTPHRRSVCMGHPGRMTGPVSRCIPSAGVPGVQAPTSNPAQPVESENNTVPVQHAVLVQNPDLQLLCAVELPCAPAPNSSQPEKSIPLVRTLMLHDVVYTCVQGHAGVFKGWLVVLRPSNSTKDEHQPANGGPLTSVTSCKCHRRLHRGWRGKWSAGQVC